MLHNLQLYILTSIQNNRFYYFYFTKFYSLTCMCVHACRSVCIHEWKPEEGYWVSCTSTFLPQEGSLSLKVELSPSWLLVTWPTSSPKDPDPPVSSCPLQPLLPLVWLLVYAVMSGRWGTELRSSSLGSKSSYPWSHFSNSFFYQILMYSGVHIRLFSTAFKS